MSSSAYRCSGCCMYSPCNCSNAPLAVYPSAVEKTQILTPPLANSVHDVRNITEIYNTPNLGTATPLLLLLYIPLEGYGGGLSTVTKCCFRGI